MPGPGPLRATRSLWSAVWLEAAALERPVPRVGLASTPPRRAQGLPFLSCGHGRTARERKELFQRQLLNYLNYIQAPSGPHAPRLFITG